MECVAKDQYFWYIAYQENWNLFYPENENWQRDWRLVYQKKLRIETNWKKNRYLKKGRLRHDQIIDCLSCDLKMWHDQPKNKKLATCSGHHVYYWDIEAGTDRRFKGHKVPIKSLATSGDIILSGDEAGNILLWDLTRSPEILPWSNISGELVAPIPNAHKGAVLNIKYNDDYLASSSFDGSVKVWDLNKMALKLTFEHTPEESVDPAPNVTQPVRCMELRDDILLTAGLENTIKLWDLGTGKNTLVIDNTNPVSCIFQNPVRSHYLYSSSVRDAGIKMWDLRLATTPIAQFREIREPIKYFVFDGSKFVVLTPSTVGAFTVGSDLEVTDHWSLGFLPDPAYCHSIIPTSSLLFLPSDSSVFVWDFDCDLTE